MPGEDVGIGERERLAGRLSRWHGGSAAVARLVPGIRVTRGNSGGRPSLGSLHRRPCDFQEVR